MEVITGVAPAEYGDKSSLVVHIVTKSGLDQAKPTGSASFGYGSFKSPTGEVNIGGGSHRFGNFISLSGLRTDRFLDPPELEALHDTGNNVSLFDRLDFRPGATDTLHLNIQAANSGFDVPNTYDQIQQTQHQNIATFNVAPGYSRVIGSNTLFTANGFVRRDHLTYTPSADPFNDTPATVSQDRMLTNFGAKADVAMTLGEPQPEIRRLDRRDPAARAVHVRHHRSDRWRVRGRGRHLQPGAGAIRPDQWRLPARLRPIVHDQAAGGDTSRTTSRPATRR